MMEGFGILMALMMAIVFLFGGLSLPTT